MSQGKWVKVSAGRHAGEARLTVSGQPDASEKVKGPRKPLALHTKLYVGGFDGEKTTLNAGVGVDQGFVGCVKDVSGRKKSWGKKFFGKNFGEKKIFVKKLWGKIFFENIFG